MGHNKSKSLPLAKLFMAGYRLLACITKYTTRLKILLGISTLAYIIFTPPSVTKVKLCEIDITHISILANFSLRITYLNGVEGGRHL